MGRDGARLKPAETVILGIDPGSAITGIGLVISCGGVLTAVSRNAVRPPSRLSFDRRLLFIADALAETIDAHPPTEAAVEDLFHAVNTRSALQLAHVRGVIVLELARRGVPLYTYAPMAVKKALTGTGAAPKEQVRAMVERLLGLRLGDDPADVSDALAVAICHAHTRGPLSR